MTISGKQPSQAFLFSSLSTEASRSQIAQQFFAEQERSFVSFSREEEFELHARYPPKRTSCQIFVIEFVESSGNTSIMKPSIHFDMLSSKSCVSSVVL